MKSLLASLFIFVPACAVGSEACIAIRSVNDHTLAGSSFVMTNTGDHTLSLADYSYDDDRRRPGAANLAQLGVLEPGESAIVTTSLIDTFCLQENSAPFTKVLVSDLIDLKRARELNIFDGRKLVTRMMRRIELHSPSFRNVTFALPASFTPGILMSRSQNMTAAAAPLLELTWLPAENGEPGTYLKFSTQSK